MYVSDLDHFHGRPLPYSHVKSLDDLISGCRRDSGVLFSFIYIDCVTSVRITVLSNIASTPISLHVALGVAEAKCILVTVVCVSVCLSVCLFVCLSLAAFPHYCTDPDGTVGVSTLPVVVHH